MNINEMTCSELACLPSGSPLEKDFRAAYQRERLRTLSKNPSEPAAITLFRVMAASHVYAHRVDARLYLPEMLRVIEGQLPTGFVIETAEDEIQMWKHLPNGNTILIFRPVNYILREANGVKDFLGTYEPTKAYALTVSPLWPTHFSLTTSYCPRGGGLCDQVKVTNFQRHSKSVWDLNTEVDRYNKFMLELTEFMGKGEF